uniref:Aminotransferase-like plant mobile domain-containing protein n=1 Tax=Aegilops tauschii TaxID=37682 RepID=M8BAC8_AEGTA
MSSATHPHLVWDALSAWSIGPPPSTAEGASKMETTVKSAANGEKHISEMTDEKTCTIFGLAIEGEDIDEKLQSTPDPNLFNTFQNNGSIDLADLETMILRSKTPDDDFLAQFVLFAIGTVLAPTTQCYVDAKYLKLVADIKSLRRLNWGCFTMKHLFRCIHKFNSLDQVSSQGNLPLLQIWYWEHLRSGKLMYPPIPPPLVARWDECTCVIRAEAYTSGGLHKGLVVMEIYARQPEANNRKDPGSKKIVRVDEGDSSRAQSQGQNMSSHKHRFDAKFLTPSEELIDIKSKSGSNPRLSLLEDEIKDLRRELKELKNQTKVSRQSESQKAGVEEQVNVCSDPFMVTPKFDASTSRTSTPTPSARHVLPNKEDPQITPLKPLFDNDYVLTVVQIGDIPLRAEQLKPIYNEKYICGDVIMAYAHISGVETDTTSVISPNETRKILETKGVIPKGRGSSWVQRVANKFVGRRKVESIQACMDEAVKDGLVTPGKPIKFTDWKVVRYDDIPQQNDGHSCAFFTLKYMLTWNGEVFTDKVEQAKRYEAHVASQPMDSKDDVQEIIGTAECKISDTSSSPKDPDTPSSPKKRRARGRPRKVVDEEQAKKTKTIEELKVKFDSKTIAK